MNSPARGSSFGGKGLEPTDAAPEYPDLLLIKESTQTGQWSCSAVEVQRVTIAITNSGGRDFFVKMLLIETSRMRANI